MAANLAATLARSTRFATKRRLTPNLISPKCNSMGRRSAYDTRWKNRSVCAYEQCSQIACSCLHLVRGHGRLRSGDRRRLENFLRAVSRVPYRRSERHRDLAQRLLSWQERQSSFVSAAASGERRKTQERVLSERQCQADGRRGCQRVAGE